MSRWRRRSLSGHGGACLCGCARAQSLLCRRPARCPTEPLCPLLGREGGVGRGRLLLPVLLPALQHRRGRRVHVQHEALPTGHLAVPQKVPSRGRTLAQCPRVLPPWALELEGFRRGCGVGGAPGGEPSPAVPPGARPEVRRSQLPALAVGSAPPGSGTSPRSVCALRPRQHSASGRARGPVCGVRLEGRRPSGHSSAPGRWHRLGQWRRSAAVLPWGHLNAGWGLVPGDSRQLCPLSLASGEATKQRTADPFNVLT